MAMRQTGSMQTAQTGVRLGPPTLIDEPLIAAIVKRLETGKPIRRTLPSGGYLHIDRQLPFLLVYRRPASEEDPVTEQLLRGESSYLIANSRRRFNKGLVKLVSAIAETLAEDFGAFLLIEIWSGKETEFTQVTPSIRPAFRILSRPDDIVSSLSRTLQKALARIKVQRMTAQVEQVESKRPWAPGLPGLIAPELAKRISCHRLGIVIRSVLHDPDTGEEFPLNRRNLHRGLGRAIRRTVFKFTSDQTTQQPPHFHALGPRSLVKLVWQVDRELAEIADNFDFLLCVTPTNADRAWSTFKRQRFEATPSFVYRPLPVDPALVKRQLYRIPIEKIEDPALEALFRAQQRELDRKLTMLGDRGTRNFLYGSLQLYGRVDDTLLQAAREVLEKVPSRGRGGGTGSSLDARALASRAEADIRYYRERDERVRSRVEIRDDVVGVMVSQGNLLINKRQKFRENRVEALLAHEIGTHVVTFFNGRAQPFQQLSSGLPDYEELQEGLAVLAEYLVGGLTRSRLRLLAGRVLAVYMISEGATFPEVFRLLNHTHNFPQKTAFNITLRVFRGGGLLKDMVYLRGLIRLLDYLGEGGELEPLLVGKFGADHLPIIKELQWRKVLSAPRLIPRYLENPQAAERLGCLRGGTTILELVKRS
jgi:uncharacterized protein (TIGR02421 family)